KFPGVAGGASLAELVYLSIKGGNPAGEPRPIDWKSGSDADAEADKALRRLTAVAAKFAVETEPYRSFERPMWTRRVYGVYDHLARVKEWSLLGGADEDEVFP